MMEFILSKVVRIRRSRTLPKMNIIQVSIKSLTFISGVQIKILKTFRNIFGPRLLLGLIIIRSVFRSLSNIYDEDYLQK